MDSRESSTLDKFTWYVRIGGEEGIDATTWLVPLFASTEFTDRRAPHNLLPIKHLENSLRRRLGSQTLIRRTIASQLSQ